MAKSYTATIDARCFKEHTCVSCGAVYTYELYRKVTGTAANPQKAQELAARNAAKAMENEVDVRPCPTCGLVQPDMIGQRRAKRIRPIFWLALVAAIVITVLRAARGVQGNTAVWIAAGFCAVTALLLWFIDLENLNRNVEANRAKAADAVTAGQVTHRSGRAGAGGGAGGVTRFGRSPIHWLALLMTLAAIGMAAAPEFLRSTKGWPLNPETYPTVAGPGDQVRIYMDEKINSIKGYWKGEVRAAVRDGTNVYPVKATTNDKAWGDRISFKSSERSTSSTPWIEVPIPANPALAGKTVVCDLALLVTYPQSSGSGTFDEHQSVMKRQASVTLASAANAGAAYNDWWWIGSVGGMGLLLVGTTFLSGAAKSLARKAAPTRCLHPAQPQPPAHVQPPGGVPVTPPPPLPPR